MNRRWLAIASLLTIAAAWGATFTLVKNILTRIAPEPFIFYRFTLAGLILLAVAVARKRLNRELLRPAITLGVLVFAGYWLQTRALMVISPSRSAFLTGLYVVMVPFCDAVVFGVRVSSRAWLGSILAVAGTSALIGGFDARPSLGDLFTVACALLFAFHVVLSARYSVQYPATGLAAVQVLFVGLAAAPLTRFVPRPQMSGSVIAVIVFTAVVTTALAFVALMWGQAYVTATEAAVILSFEPVAASLTSILWDHEPMTVPFLIGAVMILGAMVVSQLPERPSARMPSDAAHPGHER